MQYKIRYLGHLKAGGKSTPSTYPTWLSTTIHTGSSDDQAFSDLSQATYPLEVLKDREPLTLSISGTESDSPRHYKLFCTKPYEGYGKHMHNCRSGI